MMRCMNAFAAPFRFVEIVIDSYQMHSMPASLNEYNPFIACACFISPLKAI